MVMTPRLSISDLLLQPEVTQHLRERFRTIQRSFTTSIREAAALTELTDVQLRYIESRRLLAPYRTSTTAEVNEAVGPPLAATSATGATPSPGQRRYTVDDLYRAQVISFLLQRHYSLSEIASFVENSASIIHDLVDAPTLALASALSAADDIQFRRFFIPHALYLALTLIFERDGIADAGIILPLREAAEELASVETPTIESASDLYKLGRVLVAWRARNHPMMTLVTTGNPFEPDQNILLRPLSDLPYAPQASSPSAPVAAYLAYQPAIARELSQADRQIAQRLELPSPAPGRADIEIANPRAVAGRLLRYVQELWFRQHNGAPAISAEQDASLYYYRSPEMMDPLLGDALLNRLANVIADLGESSPAPVRQRADVTEEGDASHWRFCCILTPRERQASPKQQQLIVCAQSEHSPHRVGLTTTDTASNNGLTVRAFTSGHVVYRANILEQDPAVAYIREEWPIHSAIAVPVAAGDGRPPAVLYVASKREKAFAADDFLLLRVLGQMVGELIQTYHSRFLTSSLVGATLDDPRIVDRYFSGFQPDADFVADLTQVIQAYGEDEPPDGRPETLTLISFDINGYSTLQRRHGDRIARAVTLQFGKRLQRQAMSALREANPHVYRIWGDRFYLMAYNLSPDEARDRALHMTRRLSTLYSFEDESGSTESEKDHGIAVSVRMAGMTFSACELIRQMERAQINEHDLAQRSKRDVDAPFYAAVSLTRLLEEGTQQARDDEAYALWWRGDSGPFEPARPLEG